MIRQRKMYILLGGVPLRPPVHILYSTRVFGKVVPKLVSLAQARTIGAEYCFHGKRKNYHLETGSILGWRKGHGESRIWYHFHSIYEAVRSFHHAGESEAQAHENAHIGIQTAIELVRDLLAYWPLSSEQRELLDQKLIELYGNLEGARDGSLVDAAECVFDAAGFEDGDGILRLHPSAAKIYAARRLMTVRMSGIACIVPRISSMQMALTAELAEERHIFLEYDLNLLLEARRIARDPRVTNASDRIGQRLRSVRDTFGVIKVAPFSISAINVRKLVLRALGIIYPATAEARKVAVVKRVHTVVAMLDEMIHEIACLRARDFLEEQIIRPVSCAVMTPTQRRQLAKRIDYFADRICALGLDSDIEIALRVALRCASQDLRANDADQAKQYLKEAIHLL